MYFKQNLKLRSFFFLCDSVIQSHKQIIFFQSSIYFTLTMAPWLQPGSQSNLFIILYCLTQWTNTSCSSCLVGMYMSMFEKSSIQNLTRIRDGVDVRPNSHSWSVIDHLQGNKVRYAVPSSPRPSKHHHSAKL